MIIKVLGMWSLSFEEISNNVYKVELTDNFSRQVGVTDHDLDRGIETCLSHAFDIEKKLGNNFNKFIYDTFKYFLSDQKLFADNYSDKSFGSWVLEKEAIRMILDGKDLVISLQTKTDLNNWIDTSIIKLSDLSFEQLKKLKVKLINES